MFSRNYLTDEFETGKLKLTLRVKTIRIYKKNRDLDSNEKFTGLVRFASESRARWNLGIFHQAKSPRNFLYVANSH